MNCEFSLNFAKDGFFKDSEISTKKNAGSLKKNLQVKTDLEMRINEKVSLCGCWLLIVFIFPDHYSLITTC